MKTRDPKKILVINTFGIGDVLFTFPFIENLKLNFPDVSIGYIGNRRTCEILKNNRHIDHVFIYERDEFNKFYRTSLWSFLKKLRGFLNEIKSHRYDVVFDFSLNTNINFFTFLLGIKERIGFNYRKRSPFLTRAIELKGFEDKHVAQYYLDLLGELRLKQQVSRLRLEISEADKQWARELIAKSGAEKGKPLIGILPGAGASWGKEARYRRWPVEKYAKLVDKMIEKLSANIILMGDKSEEELCQALEGQRGKRIVKAYGQTSLGQLSALLSLCDLVVLNDGGPLHIAVAVDTRTVSIFGPVDHRVYGPYGDPVKHLIISKDLPCQPCYRKFRVAQCSHISCLEQITVDDVFRKVEQLL